MKKAIIALLIVAVIGTIGLVGCGETAYKITFDVDGEVYATAETDENGKVNLPEMPEKNGFLFDGWYTDKDTFADEFTADSKVEKDLTVYAKWLKIDETVTYDASKSELENGAALQAKINEATDGAVIFVTKGEYDVTHDDAENVAYDHNLLITNDNITLVGEDGAVISSVYSSGMGDAQQTVMIKGDNVTLKNLKINPVEEYYNKTVEIMNAKNTVIEDCEIVGNLYIGGAETGAYTVAGNTFTEDSVSIVVANGAGNGMSAGEKAVIQNNVCEGALYLTGTRNTDWDLNELTNLPEITGNTFGKCTQEVNGQEYDMYIRIASTVKANLDKINVDDIKTNNSFDGKSGSEWEKTDVEDTTLYNGTFYRFYY